MIIVAYRNVFFAISVLIVAASAAAVFVFGLQFGIDFTGGTLVEVRYASVRPEGETITESLEQAGFRSYSLREVGEQGFVLRAGTMSEGMRANLSDTISIGGEYPAAITRLSEIGPTIGVELRNKAFTALLLVLLCILLFIAFAFRKVSKPVSSWIYGLIALVALIHDVIVPVGFFAVLGHLTGAQIDTLFVTAILTVLGFSIHDTIVVFDRVRENLRLNQEKVRREEFELTAGRSLQQTFVRSVNTSLTVLVTLLALYFLGPVSTQDFALTLLVGIIAGTFSSIFLATPLLVSAERYLARGRA